jgi:hypothetical protein
MEIKGTIHCFFEQSGTFKNEFKKLGYYALDYDVQNEYGETDFIIDLFKNIEDAYCNKPSIFDNISNDDLIIAFFPCVYFETIQQLDFALSRNGTMHKPLSVRIDYALDRLNKRTYLHSLLYKFVHICDTKNLRLIIENPATPPNYLITGQNFPTPTLVDKNRMLRGDYFKKPTAYWFFNCEPTYGESYQNDKVQKLINKCEPSKGNGLCGGERSLISSDYARNFICDFIIGKSQNLGQIRLF